MLAFFSCAERDAEKGASDHMLEALAQRLQAAGLRLAGAVQHNIDRPDGPCDMDLSVLGSGHTVRISQRLGPGATGCRMDAGALETAVAMAESTLAGADLLIVNKFGRQEAMGRGFRPLIGQALATGVPVLLAVNAGYRADFDAFAGDVGEELAPSDEALAGWCGRMLTVGA